MECGAVPRIWPCRRRVNGAPRPDGAGRPAIVGVHRVPAWRRRRSGREIAASDADAPQARAAASSSSGQRGLTSKAPSLQPAASPRSSRIAAAIAIIAPLSVHSASGG